jgi:negative regulator of genetic competence, sporulation and motility
MDELLEAPVISYGKGSDKKYVTECFLNKDTGEVTNNYESRLYEYENISENSDSSLSEYAYAGICPDFLLN